jgi:hypothetical protein
MYMWIKSPFPLPFALCPFCINKWLASSFCSTHIFIQTEPDLHYVFICTTRHLLSSSFWSRVIKIILQIIGKLYNKKQKIYFFQKLRQIWDALNKSMNSWFVGFIVLLNNSVQCSYVIEEGTWREEEWRVSTTAKGTRTLPLVTHNALHTTTPDEPWPFCSPIIKVK